MANDKTKKERRKNKGVRLEYTQKKIITPRFRAQFVNRLFEPDDKDKFSVCALFDKSEDRTEMKREIKRVAQEAFGKLKPGMKTPFRKGEEKEGEYQGFDSNIVFCNIGTYKQPGIRDTHRRPLDDDAYDDGDIKSGDYMRACVFAKPFNQEGSRGVSFVLCSLLWLEEGDSLYDGGAKSDPLDDFKDEYVDEPDDFDGDSDGEDLDDNELDDLID